MAKTIVVPIEGMSCNHCVQTIEKSLGKLDSVLNVKVDLKGKQATLEVALNPEESRKQIESAIVDLGYEVPKDKSNS